MIKKLIPILLLVLSGCTSTPNFLSGSRFDKQSHIQTYYENTGRDTVNFVKLIKESSGLNVAKGFITSGSMFFIHQSVDPASKHDLKALDSISAQLKNQGYREQFDTITKILFVQLKPDSIGIFNSDVIHEKVETVLDQNLTKAGLGKWIAGDIGPAGANMLYSVTDWNKAIDISLRLLEKEKLLKYSIITKRLYFDHNNWTYEIVYPFYYTGYFNAM